MLDAKCANLNEIERGIEDRNRTAPFPFCGNRFEFRAVGSSQNCSFPMAMIDTCFADGMRALSELIEGGAELRDACAVMFEENERVIFTGNGYSAEWPAEAESRGLPNLRDAVSAAEAFNSAENKELFERMGVFTPAEVDARAECFLENYVSCIEIEAQTMIEMVKQGVEPALSADLATHSSSTESKRYTSRFETYEAVSGSCEELEAALAGIEEVEDLHGKAVACRDTVKVAMEALRTLVDKSELLCAKSLWPYPDYADCCFGHHHTPALK